MEMVLNNGFSNLNEYELVLIDGGVDWDLVGATVSTVGLGYIGTQVGGKIGATVGTAAGPVGTVVGGLIGSALGAIIYSFWD